MVQNTIPFASSHAQELQIVPGKGVFHTMGAHRFFAISYARAFVSQVGYNALNAAKLLHIGVYI
jgi:hypothetical protein